MSDGQRCAVSSGIVLLALTAGLLLSDGRARKLYNLIPESGVTKQNRADAAWVYQYRAEHHCALTGNTRSDTEYHRTGFISSSSTTTEYEWKCEGGDVHWTR